MKVEIYRERIPSTDARCRRNVLHDSRAWLYRHDTSGLTIQDVDHQRILGVLNQGQVGACTAFCGTGTLGTAPYYTPDIPTLFAKAFGSFDGTGAYRLYSAEENLDGDGPYPPQDNGSTGLTLAKALRAAGLISGWTQTFTLDDSLKALSQYPLATGTLWFNSMFTPSSEGVVTVNKSSGVAGGHEYEVVGYNAARGLVKFANSWGTDWGVAGYFYLQAEDWGALLADQGDVTIFTPNTQPAPAPTPDPTDPDAALGAALRNNDWAFKKGYAGTAAVKKAARKWLFATGR